MNEIGCAVEGCPEVFRTNEPVSPGARFICKNHPRKTQCAVVPGRAEALQRAAYDEEKDNGDSVVRFQECQFDRNGWGSGHGPDK